MIGRVTEKNEEGGLIYTLNVLGTELYSFNEIKVKDTRIPKYIRLYIGF